MECKIEGKSWGKKFDITVGTCFQDFYSGDLMVVTELVTPKKIMIAPISDKDLKNVEFEVIENDYGGTMIHGFCNSIDPLEYENHENWNYLPVEYTLRCNGHWVKRGCDKWSSCDENSWNCAEFVKTHNIKF